MIGERLLDLRKDADMTQDELAAVLKINKHSISSYEREKSEPPDAIKIEMAKFFRVSVDYLLGLTNDPDPKCEQRFVLRLPEGFPEEARRSVCDYVEFLAKKYSDKPIRK